MFQNSFYKINTYVNLQTIIEMLNRILGHKPIDRVQSAYSYHIMQHNTETLYRNVISQHNNNTLIIILIAVRCTPHNSKVGKRILVLRH